MWNYKEIKNRLIKNLKNNKQKLEGSFSHDNVSAVSEELSRLYKMEVEPLLDNALIDTATGRILTGLAKDRGVYRKECTYSKGEVTITGEKKQCNSCWE